MKKLTDKVQYSQDLKNELSDAQIELINILAEKEPSCYADIADFILGAVAAKDERIKELEDALILIYAENTRSLDKAKVIAAKALNL